jgi:hypothetical protein
LGPPGEEKVPKKPGFFSEDREKCQRIKVADGGLKMKPGRVKQLICSIVAGVLVLSVAPLSHALEIKFLKLKYDKVQQRVDLGVKEVAVMTFDQAKNQEALGKVIASGGSEMNINQPEYGKRISIAGQLDWLGSRAKMRLAAAMMELDAVVAKEARILGPGAIQERLGTMILAKAQIGLVHNVEARIDDIYNASRHQEVLGFQIVKAARLDWASEEMAKSVFATIQGRITPEISGEVIRTLESTGGFGHAEDFRLGLFVLAGERGERFTQLMPPAIAPLTTRGATYAGAGWGGFAEYGFATVAGFIFVMYLFAGILTDVEPPVEKEEEKPYEYPKAA